MSAIFLLLSITISIPVAELPGTKCELALVQPDNPATARSERALQCGRTRSAIRSLRHCKFLLLCRYKFIVLRQRN